MDQVLLIERVMDQTRLAVIEDGALCEVYTQWPDPENVTGNIYVGQVQNVVSGLDAAFIDIGMKKNGFLSGSDIVPRQKNDDNLHPVSRQGRIDRIVHPGDRILVQAVRSQPGAKGPRLSGHITLTGRKTVLLSDAYQVGVSHRIEDEQERRRLTAIGSDMVSDKGCGVILRTAANGASADSLKNEYERLYSEYTDFRRIGDFSAAPKLLHDDNDLLLQIARDRINACVQEVWVDGDQAFDQLTHYMRLMSPEYLSIVKKHSGEVPLFDLFRVESQIGKALERVVRLKNGGTIVIEETEAFVSVDVNTGKYSGGQTADNTIVTTNCEAARELMRQIRLRDLSGIIVVDFIDMKRDQDRKRVLDVLDECARYDRNTVTIVGFTPLGLLELTRKRSRQSLSRQLTRPCCACDGKGRIPSKDVTARSAIRELWKRERRGEEQPLLLEADPAVCSCISSIGIPYKGGVEINAVTGYSDGGFRITTLQHPNGIPLK